jgi:23S rRNA pseudouridine1911/1915/1917 synthase
MKDINLLVGEDGDAQRLDLYLKNHQELKLSRSYIQTLIDENKILVNTKPSKASHRLLSGDNISIDIPEPKILSVEPEDLPLDIVYEDDDLFVINKSANMVTHPSANNYSGTLVNALMYHALKNNSKLSDINGVLRPGIVHRLDKDTSGLILVAKNNHAHQSLALQISQRSCLRLYKALAHGKMASLKSNNSSRIQKQFVDISKSLALDNICGVVDQPIGRHPKIRQKMGVVTNGRSAKTYWQLLEGFRFASKDFALLECKLETGRTHQIRVHLAHIKRPIVGDTAYSNLAEPFRVARPLLHSSRISFSHPTSARIMQFSSELPEDFGKILDLLRAQ